MAGELAGFVGREGELSRLLAAVSGDVRLVLVVGDAGVGKSRFVGEGMARAAAAGAVVVRGECLPLAEALPLLPVAAAVSELARLNDGGVMAAALDAAPAFVRAEVGRLAPGLGADGEAAPSGRDDEWWRGRLFSAVAELLAAAARGAGGRIGLVVEDVHWADGATLDFLTLLTRAGSWSAVAVVATCRGDEALAAHVADWLAQMRGVAGVDEIRLGPLSRVEVAQQVAALADGPVPQGVADELYARAEGNPFFTEQLVAAGLAGEAAGGMAVPGGLPGRLAELLVARAARCGGEATAVLAGLAVAGRPLTEELLGTVTRLAAATVLAGLRELADARLLAEDTANGAYRARHALLAEAVAGALLPGERALLHEHMARALAAAGKESMAAEVAAHWQAAGCPAEELPTRVAAGEAAERIFGYAEAAVHWQRAIELCRARPDAESTAGIDVPGLYQRAIDALQMSGDALRAGAVAEDAYRQFAGHLDPATAAAVRHRAALHRAIETSGAGLQLMEEALRLFEQAPPSAQYAKAWLNYADMCLRPAGRMAEITPALNRALEVAEAVGAAALIPQILASLADDAFRRGQVEEGFAFLDRGWALARAADDGVALVWLAVNESEALVKLARFGDAADVALRGLEAARQSGLDASWAFSVLAAGAAEALLAGGRTAEAAAVIDPLTTEAPDSSHWPVYEARAEHRRTQILGDRMIRAARP